MTGRISALSAMAVLFAGFAALAAELVASKPLPIDDYKVYKRHGFKVMLNKYLGQGAPALRYLDDRLGELMGVVPAAYLGIARDVTIWIEPGDPAENHGPSEPANDVAYLPLGEASRLPAFGYLPARAGGIWMHANTRLLPPETAFWERWQPGWLLHEFAHALHERVLGQDHALVKAAYRQAMDRRLYADVEARLYRDGGSFHATRIAHYARTNHLEYFAELSVCYLGQSKSVFPFTREDLKRYDPAGYELMAGFWQSIPSQVVNVFPFPVAVDRVAATGRRFRLFDLMPAKEKTFDAWSGMTLVVTDLFDGTEYQFGNPAADGRTWRLTTDAGLPAAAAKSTAPKVPR